MLRNLVLSAAAAGLAAGLLTSALQQVTTTPLIIEAERYEGGGHLDHAAVRHDQGLVLLVHATSAAEAPDAAEWAPAEGIERSLYTSLATIVLGFGFSLALLGAMLLAGGPVDGRTGLLFGIAGFAATALAPALGLPPEIPGSGAAALADRQLWWAMTAVATAGGLAGLFLGRSALPRIAGLVAIALPHVIGAPHPDAYLSTAPAELAGHFAAASLVLGAVFWAVLGFASGRAYAHFARPG
ncbi:CbtA family protein [Propylenella binzhouense]|uniref:Cobalt transporter n=1 Tax=Propylenella binzhouense TaxID=2555902 RepID=A0A964T6K6_9HYPH|nr:CbtA family protein [Propylenella binzhouense]MYZ49481.1 cobalt transporter [Propylenella binzhouense]